MKVVSKVYASLFTLILIVFSMSLPVFAQDGSGSAGSSFYATSCQQVKTQNPQAADGEYQIVSDSHVLTVYCANMNTAPAEYLSLVQTGDGHNFAQATAGWAYSGTTVVTRYTKVRFLPDRVGINTADRKFSTSTGNINNGAITSVDYGAAEGCNWTANGLANVDLTGTYLKIAPNQFFITGWPTGHGTIDYSQGDQVVNLTGGDYCGSTATSSQFMQLAWQYQGLQMSAPSVSNTGTATITATLKDAAGQPVAGQTVEFQASIGTIHATGVTDTNGVATTTLQYVGADTTAQIEAVSATGGSYGRTSVDFKSQVQTLVIAGANGSPGDRDAYTEFSMDNGQTWHEAYLYGTHPWGFVPGTDSWLNCAPNGQSPQCLNRSVLYRIRFQVPADATNANMRFDVKADNYATISLNGQHIVDIEGENSPNVDASIASAIQPGLNQILMNVTDQGGWAGINYKITITMNAAQPPVLVDPAPTATVVYSTTIPTNKDVVATLQPSEPITVTNNGGAASHTFTDNGSFTFQFVDSAGNTGETTASVSNIDKTAPVSKDNAPVGWQASDVTVVLSASDADSGVASTHYAIDGGPSLTGTSVTLTGEGKHTISYYSVDKAGNQEAVHNAMVLIDKSTPTVVGAATEAANANGWYKDTVTVHFTCQDSVSGIAQCSPDADLSNEGANQSVQGYAVDLAGNRSDVAVGGINIDKTAPVTTDNAPTGWQNHPVTLAFNATDSGSGVAATYYSVDGAAVQTGTSLNLTEDGEHAISYYSVDRAGNIEAAHSVTVQIDQTAPTLEVMLDKTDLWAPNHKLATIHATVTATDKESGIQSIVLTSITSNEPDNGLGDGDTANDIQGAEIGTLDTQFQLRAERAGTGNGRIYTITYTAIDHAGNHTTTTAAVTVPHDKK